MADWVSYNLTGADALSARFKGLTEEMRRKVVTPAAKDAMDIVLLDAKDRAARIDDPETANFIPANLAMVDRKALGEELGAVVISVGVRMRKKARRAATRSTGGGWSSGPKRTEQNHSCDPHWPTTASNCFRNSSARRSIS